MPQPSPSGYHLREDMGIKNPIQLPGWDFLYASGGERGIRTPGTLRYNGFQDHRIRPLCHLTVCGCAKVGSFMFWGQEIGGGIWVSGG